MNTVERMQLLYENYEQAEVDQILRSVTHDAVTVIAHELSTLRGKKDIDPSKFEDSKSYDLALAIVDELADRMKAEMRYRCDQAEKILRYEKEVEKQLDNN